MKETILITGGAGFIGSHLCRRLIQENKKVICVDNLSSGAKENIFDLLHINNFRFIIHDINLPLSLDVDMIYNLACPASPTQYQKDPIQTLKTNVIGSLNILELAQECGAKVLQASTSEIYGDPLEHPQCEEHWGNVNPIGPRACYDEGKRISETMFTDFGKLRRLDTKITRIFNTYGPYMRIDDGRVIPNFIKQALKGEDITIYGSGYQTRSFCYVDDIIDGLIRMMESSCSGPINLGTPVSHTIEEIADIIISLTGTKSKKINVSLPQDDPQRRCPDISKAQNLLNWTPQISLEKGLSDTIQYFKTQL